MFMYCNTAQNNFDFMDTCANKSTIHVFLISIHTIRRTGDQWLNTKCEKQNNTCGCYVFLNESIVEELIVINRSG